MKLLALHAVSHAPSQTDAITSAKPGNTLSAKDLPPALMATAALLTVLVLRARKMACWACVNVISFCVTRLLVEATVECASASPASMAAIMTP